MWAIILFAGLFKREQNKKWEDEQDKTTALTTYIY